MIDELVRPARIGPLLTDATGDQRWREPAATLIAGGKSNLTFELTSPAGSLILRRPPSGDLPPSAHDMGREVRVQRALADTDVPVPPIVLYHDDPAALGVPFYVMSKVDGQVITSTLPESYPDTAPQEITDALVDTLAELHRVDVDEVGLTDFGRPQGFLARQVRRWSKQAGEPVPAIERLATRLAERLPADRPGTLVHGDFRLDNCLMHPALPGTVAAVLDWEMATLGDPLTDLGLLLFYWREAGEQPIMLTPTVTAQPGFPGRAYVIERYARQTGRDVSAIAYYEAFAHLKFAVIAQGIAARVAAGAMAGQDFGDLSGEIVRLAEAGLAALDQH